jgi:hypothetical protein
MDDSVPAGPLTSRADVRIAAIGVPPERLREIVRWDSPVSDAIGRAIPKTVDVEAF